MPDSPSHIFSVTLRAMLPMEFGITCLNRTVRIKRTGPDMREKRAAIVARGKRISTEGYRKQTTERTNMKKTTPAIMGTAVRRTISIGLFSTEPETMLTTAETGERCSTEEVAGQAHGHGDGNGRCRRQRPARG